MDRLNFDPVARLYQPLERITFGGALQRRRIAMLPRLKFCRRALLIGDGDARFLAELRRRFPAADVDFVEASGQMIAIAQARITRLPGSGSVQFIHASVPESFQPSGEYDLVTTHFVLDVMTQAEISNLLACVLPATTIHTRWMVSDFAVVPQHPVLHRASAFAIRGMYEFFGLTCRVPVRRLPDHSSVFRRYGMSLRQRETAWSGFLFSELWGCDAIPPEPSSGSVS